MFTFIVIFSNEKQLVPGLDNLVSTLNVYPFTLTRIISTEELKIARVRRLAAVFRTLLSGQDYVNKFMQ